MKNEIGIGQLIGRLANEANDMNDRKRSFQSYIYKLEGAIADIEDAAKCQKIEKVAGADGIINICNDAVQHRPWGLDE